MRAFVLSLCLMAVPVSSFGQFVEAPEGDAGEVVLAYTSEALGAPRGASTSLTVWESGYAELILGSYDPATQAMNARILRTVVGIEDLRELKRNLIELGILQLDGRIVPICPVCFRPPPPFQRVTFISRVPKRVRDLVERRPYLHERFKVYLRPREGSFAAVQRDPSDPRNAGGLAADQVLNRIFRFYISAFPYAFPS